MCLLSFDQTIGPREPLRFSSRIQLNKSRLKNSTTSLDVYNKTFWLHRLEGSILSTKSWERLTVLQNVLQAHTKAGIKLGTKLVHRCGVSLDVSFFSHVKKKHRSRFWLVRTHWCIEIYDIAFQWVYLSMYTDTIKYNITQTYPYGLISTDKCPSSYLLYSTTLSHIDR